MWRHRWNPRSSSCNSDWPTARPWMDGSLSRGFSTRPRNTRCWCTFMEAGGRYRPRRVAGKRHFVSPGIGRRWLSDRQFRQSRQPAPKGRAWRKAVYGAVGVLSAQEQTEAVLALARQRPYVDVTRVGVWGWSGGGSNTLNLMFRSPDLFSVGVSVAPVPDQKLYDTIYQERYMGLPEENAQGYRSGSPINFAEGLRGKLLIVHGSGDDNVHFQGTQKLLNRLIELGKPFEFMGVSESYALNLGGERNDIARI